MLDLLVITVAKGPVPVPVVVDVGVCVSMSICIDGVCVGVGIVDVDVDVDGVVLVLSGLCLVGRVVLMEPRLELRQPQRPEVPYDCLFFLLTNHRVRKFPLVGYR